MRQRSQTIGPLGRSPARQGSPAPAAPPPDDQRDSGGKSRGLVRQWIHGALFDNTGLKFLSMVLAVTVFLLINTDKDREITVRLGVNYDAPADKVLTSKPIEDVRVTIKGPWRRLRQFDERELSRIVLPLRDAPTGDIPITPDMITGLPPGLVVTSISPKVAHVEFDRSIEKVVEIDPLVTGLPRHGYVKTGTKASPTTIKVRGGASLLGALSSIRTTEVNIDDKPEDFEDLAAPAPPEGVTVVDKTQRITVVVRISQALVMRAQPRIAILPRGPDNTAVDPARWTITPSQVDVELTGPQLLVEKIQEDLGTKLVPTVKIDRTVSAGDTKPRVLDVKLDGIPANSGVGVKLSPDRVNVTPVVVTNKPPAPPP